MLINLDDENLRSKDQVAEHLEWIAERVHAGVWQSEVEGASWWNVRTQRECGPKS